MAYNKEIKYQKSKRGKLLTKCPHQLPYKERVIHSNDIYVGSNECDECKYNKGHYRINEIVVCL